LSVILVGIFSFPRVLDSATGMEFAEEGFTVFILESGAGFEESNVII